MTTYQTTVQTSDRDIQRLRRHDWGPSGLQVPAEIAARVQHRPGCPRPRLYLSGATLGFLKCSSCAGSARLNTADGAVCRAAALAAIGARPIEAPRTEPAAEPGLRPYVKIRTVWWCTLHERQLTGPTKTCPDCQAERAESRQGRASRRAAAKEMARRPVRERR